MENNSAHTCGNTLNDFSENAEVSSLISSLPHVCSKLRTLEASQERFTVILDKYQEQPHLLDPYLEALIQQLFVLATPSSAPVVMHQAFKYLYLISKVRGAKVTVRWFSHEVSDMDPVLGLLQQQDIEDHETWETRYILLLWLSIIVIIPFNLSRMDGSKQFGGQDDGHQTTVDRVLEVAKMYLHATDKSRDAAALLLAKFLSRPDVKKLKMAEFLDWCLMILNEADRNTTKGMAVLTGVLITLSSLFKHGKREEMVEYAPTILTHLAKFDLANSTNTLFRKLNIKLAQRLGMTFLSARLASWRYTRGNRSLEETLAGSSSDPSTSSQQSGDASHDNKEEGYDVPEEMEEVLGLLLNGLRDRDTVVRWSAAKGVGRTTGRLPKELGDEVVGSLLEFFSVRESDTAWHGGCLALAELGRRGLLLPQRLKDVVPVVLKALVYDERRGSYSVGSHVRDAACYVCWSFARAYDPEELKPYVTDIAIALVITTVFDREVNCRRAASAAFQENVGRQGTFPHGIDILTTADYFAVGTASNAYLNLSVFVAQYSEYTRPLIDHLVKCKLSHWDSVIRELAADALHNLTIKDSAYMKEEILPSLLPLVTTPDPSLRHGALCAVAELSFALFEHAQSSNTTFIEYVGIKIISELAQIVPRLQDSEVFKGIIGEIMRPATLKFIERMCLCKLPLDDSPKVIKSWQAIVDDNLAHTEEYIRDAASSALKHLCTQYYCTDIETISRMQNNIVSVYITQLSSPIHFVRMGASLRLGALPKPLLVGKLSFILDKLMHCVVTIKDCDPKFVEARRDAVKAISSICQTVGVSSSGHSEECICADNIGPIYQCLFAAMRDYTTDSRGDIGTVVREASMTAIVDLFLLVSSTEKQLLTEEIVKETVCCLVQQSNEKIDRTRALACTKLVTLIHHTPALPHIPHHDQLIKIFDKPKLLDVNWAAPHLSFSFTIQLLGLSTYSYATLLGLIVSVGGLTESTVRYSSLSLLSFLKNVCHSHEKMDPFCSDVLKVFQEQKQDARVIVSLFKTLDLLLSNGIFDAYMKLDSHTFTSSLLKHAKDEVSKSKDVKKLLASINVFCGLLQFPSIRKSTLNQVMLLLCHHYPKVRKTTADQFYITLVSYDDVIDAEVADDVITILSDTAWDGNLTSIRAQRDSLCDLLGLPKPKIIKKAEPSKEKKRKVAGDLDSYKDLVDRAGY